MADDKSMLHMIEHYEIPKLIKFCDIYHLPFEYKTQQVGIYHNKTFRYENDNDFLELQWEKDVLNIKANKRVQDILKYRQDLYMICATIWYLHSKDNDFSEELLVSAFRSFFEDGMSE